ncbi:hypothetical protein AAHC03_010290 [Spirometra sp. Aus1]
MKLSTTSKGILNGWSDEEDLSLLDAIEQYGLGNWEDVSEKCVKKSPKECFDHYNTSYLHGVLAKVLSSGVSKPSHVTDHTSSPQSSPDKTSKFVPLEPLEQQLLGYMVLRDDFEKDYDNDAESLLTRLKLHPDWDELENALIVAHVGIYAQRLQERQKRKEIARIHGLIQRISSYLLNRRVKRRPLPVKQQPPQRQQPRKATTVSSKLALSKNPHCYSVVRAAGRRSRGSVSPEKRRSAQSSPVSPPAGSWLAAPYALQSRGPTRGTPLVVPGVLSLPLTQPPPAGNVSTIAAASAVYLNGVGGGGVNSAQPALEDELEGYDAFNINEKLKPFLRYFSPQQAKQFLHNLHREEVLKHEIKFLLGVLQKSSAGCTKSSAIKLRPAPVHSQVFVPAPKNPDPPILQAILSPITDSPICNSHKKRRRPRTSPWYMRVRSGHRRRY